MFSALRWQLTGLYTGAAVLLMLTLTLSTYSLLAQYFQHTTDLGLQHKMAHEFRLLGAPLPPELAAADRDWVARRAIFFPPREDSDAMHAVHDPATDYAEEFYDGELSAIFVLILDREGNLVYDPNPITPPLAPDRAAVAAALAHGSDLRTIQLSNGSAVRLLTYPLSRPDGPAVLQLGRALLDQQRILRQLVVILSVFGVAGAVVVGGVSWWLAGRAIRPAQEAWHRQQIFIANASHELRTPLALIRVTSEAVLRRLPAETTRLHELLTDLVAASDHATQLVADLLLLSRLDTKRLVLTCTPLALAEFLPTLMRQTTPLAEAHGITLHCTGAAGCVRADADRLRQVLLIVLENAFRYTPAGGQVQVHAAPVGAYVQITVTDTGRGIAPEDLPHVFERFYRGAHARAQGEGSGLGLPIAQSLMHAMRGEIRVTSTYGHGTTVTLRLPSG